MIVIMLTIYHGTRSYGQSGALLPRGAFLVHPSQINAFGRSTDRFNPHDLGRRWETFSLSGQPIMRS